MAQKETRTSTYQFTLTPTSAGSMGIGTEGCQQIKWTVLQERNIELRKTGSLNGY